MRMVVRAFALVLFLGTLGLWAGLGGTFGWTRTFVPHGEPAAAGKLAKMAPGFGPGAEFLVLGVGGAVIVFAATLFVKMTPK